MLKEIYGIISRYLLNGFYAYALFGIYALTISPFITEFIDYGVKSLFVAIFGFTMLIAEFFALNFKLKMIRIRTEEKRIEYKRITGTAYVLPPNRLLFFGLFIRIALRLAVIMVCMTALGYASTEKEMSPQSLIVLFTGFLLDVGALIYIYLKMGPYMDPIDDKDLITEEAKKNEEWNKIHLPIAASGKYYLKEVFSDIILQIYAVMLFTSVWTFINQTGIKILYESHTYEKSALWAAFDLFPMLFIMTLFVLMPMRIAYWIEDSMMSFTKRQRVGTGFIFFIVAIFTCAPSIVEFCTLYFIKSPSIAEYIHSEAFSWSLTALLIVIVISIQIFLSGEKQLSLVIADRQVLEHGKRMHK